MLCPTCTDATSNLDRQDSKLFRIMTCSPAGGLPLGIIITSSEDEETLKKWFELLKEVLPSYAFFRRGPEAGPKVKLQHRVAR